METRLLAAACLSLFVAAPLPAAIYQWTDEHGRTHFSDRPDHQSAQPMALPKTAPPSGSPAIPVDRQKMRQRMLDVYEQERTEKREAAAKEKQTRAERKRRCLNARGEYEDYSSAGSLYEYLDNGERRYLDRQQREQYMARLKAEIERYCD